MTKAMRSEMALSRVGFDADERPNAAGASASGVSERSLVPDPVSGPRVVSSFVAADHARVAELLRSHFRDVWRMVRRFGVPENYADDAAQEVFIIAARRIDDIVCGSERPFLLATAVRVAANLRRSLGTRRECPEDEQVSEGIDPRPSAEALLDQKRLRQMLDRVLDSLTDDLRVSFVLYELEGLSSPEIAALLRIPLGTVASRLRRAREAFEVEVARLKAELSQKGGL